MRDREDRPVPVFLMKEQWKLLDDTLWAVCTSNEFTSLSMTKNVLNQKLIEIAKNIKEVLGE